MRSQAIHVTTRISAPTVVPFWGQLHGGAAVIRKPSRQPRRPVANRAVGALNRPTANHAAKHGSTRPSGEASCESTATERACTRRTTNLSGLVHAIRCAIHRPDTRSTGLRSTEPGRYQPGVRCVSPSPGQRGTLGRPGAVTRPKTHEKTLGSKMTAGLFL